MKLQYHTGKNFGDAVNPIIFNHYLGNLLDEQTDTVIIGIGSILGLFNKPDDCTKVYIFSSGFAGGDESTYGAPPQLDDSYEVICVRGKRTAKALKISEDLAIADGALLLPLVKPENPSKKKQYQYAYMPHVGTLDIYDKWKDLIESLGIHFIDPGLDPEIVLSELNQTEVLLTEAMHGAIIADGYRIPWIPVKTIKTVNTFKWQDYCESLDLEYIPHHTPTLFSKPIINNIIKIKLGKLRFLSSIITPLYMFYQKVFVIPKVKQKFKSLMSVKSILSTKDKLQERQNQLVEKMMLLKQKIQG